MATEGLALVPPLPRAVLRLLHLIPRLCSAVCQPRLLLPEPAPASSSQLLSLSLTLTDDTALGPALIPAPFL